MSQYSTVWYSHERSRLDVHEVEEVPRLALKISEHSVRALTRLSRLFPSAAQLLANAQAVL